MLSAQNIKIARKEGFHIIGCCPETRNEVVNALSCWDDEDISRWENAVKRYSEGMVYVKGWKGTLYGQSGLITVVLDPTRKAMEKANRDMMMMRVNELKGVLSSVIVKQRGRRGFRVDDNLVQQEEFIDGRFLTYLLRTIVKFRLKKAGIDMSVDQAVDELKNLTLVEFSYKGRMRWKLSRATKK
jgi:hypothetical protein